MTNLKLRLSHWEARSNSSNVTLYVLLKCSAILNSSLTGAQESTSDVYIKFPGTCTMEKLNRINQSRNRNTRGGSKAI